MRLTHLRDLVSHSTRPDAPALGAPGRGDLAYRELAHQVRATGERLRELGIATGDPVALALHSGPELAAAFLSVACYTPCAPLNPAYQQAEFEHFLSDMGARALVVPADTPSAATAAAQDRGVPVIELETRPDSPAGVFGLRGEPLGPAAGGTSGPDDVAMILYTSGTIARPRRVPLTHHNLMAAATNTGRTYALGPDDRCLCVMPLYHAHGLTSTLLASLRYGASVVCPPGFDASRFLDWLDACHPTWYTAVPAMHTAALNAAAGREEELARHHLRFIRSASAPLPGPVLDRLERAFEAPVIEAYGMTEAASLVTSNPLPPGVRKRGSVGLPVGEPVRILDEKGRKVPVGSPGEIAIRGANVMSGYGDDPAANSVAFVDGWLRTGDYGYLDDDGYLFVVGRVKEIINRGGSKVSPAEVDEALAGHPDLAEVAAFAVPHDTLGEDVAVAVVPRTGTTVSEHEVRAFAADRLVAYKVPSRVIVTDRIPRNATGKVQRLRLAERYATRRRDQSGGPVTATAATIVAIWCRVLGTDEVGLTENFFDLGGDSLRLAAVADGLKAELGRELPLPELLMYPTVRALAEHLDADADADAEPARQASTVDDQRWVDARTRLQRQRRMGSGGGSATPEAG